MPSFVDCGCVFSIARCAAAALEGMVALMLLLYFS